MFSIDDLCLLGGLFSIGGAGSFRALRYLAVPVPGIQPEPGMVTLFFTLAGVLLTGRRLLKKLGILFIPEIFFGTFQPRFATHLRLYC